MGFELPKSFGEDPFFLLSLLIKFVFAFSSVLKHIYNYQQSKNYYSRHKDNVLLFYSSILKQKEITIIFLGVVLETKADRTSQPQSP